MAGTHDQAARRPSRAVRVVLSAIAMLLIVLFAGLGTWQVYRLQWKLALIERVETRVHAAPVAAPTPSEWGRVSKASHEYRRVRLAGTYLYEFTTPVLAVSDLGSGYWLLTPLCQPDGSIVLVNRGFVPAEQGGPKRYPGRRADAPACKPGAPQATVTGLLRLTEPGGGFLRDNDPVNNRWFSRDVQAIAIARGLYNVAPYFVDAARGQEPAGAPDHPTGGLTVIRFVNNHLVYALTWYALALMVLGAWWWLARGGANRDTDDARTD